MASARRERTDLGWRGSRSVVVRSRACAWLSCLRRSRRSVSQRPGRLPRLRGKRFPGLGTPAPAGRPPGCGPAPPRITSSPAPPTRRSSPPPPARRSSPARPRMTSSPPRPTSRSAPGVPLIRSTPSRAHAHPHHELGGRRLVGRPEHEPAVGALVEAADADLPYVAACGHLGLRLARGPGAEDRGRGVDVGHPDLEPRPVARDPQEAQDLEGRRIVDGRHRDGEGDRRRGVRGPRTRCRRRPSAARARSQSPTRRPPG